MIEVRQCRPADVTPLVRLCQELHAESDWSWVPFSAAAMRRSIQQMMRKPDYAPFIAVRDGELVGLLFATVGTVLYGRTLYATDVEFTAKAGGDELLDAMREWAISVGAKVRVMGVSNSGREAVKDRWFRMKGFERTGGMYTEKFDE